MWLCTWSGSFFKLAQDPPYFNPESKNRQLKTSCFCVLARISGLLSTALIWRASAFAWGALTLAAIVKEPK